MPSRPTWNKGRWGWWLVAVGLVALVATPFFSPPLAARMVAALASQGLSLPVGLQSLRWQEGGLHVQGLTVGDMLRVTTTTLQGQAAWPPLSGLDKVILEGAALDLPWGKGSSHAGDKDQSFFLPAHFACRHCSLTLATPWGKVTTPWQAQVNRNKQGFGFELNGQEIILAERHWQAHGWQVQGSLSPSGQPKTIHVTLERLVLGDLGLALRDGTLTLHPPQDKKRAPGQTLHLAALNLGLPLKDITLNFALDHRWRVQEASLHGQLLGGEITAGPVTPAEGDATWHLTPQFSNLQLSHIVTLMDLPGLVAEGSLSGPLPLEISPAGVRVRDGELVSQGPGMLRYQGEEGALLVKHGLPEIVMAAMSDFHYEEIRVTLQRQVDGEMEVALVLKGNNPQLYEGHPVLFNIHLSGPLDGILRQGLRSLNLLPSLLQQRLEESTSRPERKKSP